MPSASEIVAASRRALVKGIVNQGLPAGLLFGGSGDGRWVAACFDAAGGYKQEHPRHNDQLFSSRTIALQEALIREGRARAAADRLLALADQGPHFTTDPGSIRREDLYERP